MDKSEVLSAATSYGTAVVGLSSKVDWMFIGGAVLLLARLIQEVPKALVVIKRWRENGE